MNNPISYDVIYRNTTITDLKLHKGSINVLCADNKIGLITCNYELQSLDCHDNCLKTLKCNKHLKLLHCDGNKLSILELNDKLETLGCGSNQLTRLNYRKLKYLNCSKNKLTTLELKDGLEELDCSYNEITSLKCNKSLKLLNCSGNKLTNLELNDGLKELDCEHLKELTSIKYIPPSLTRIYCTGTNFDFDTKLRIIKWSLQGKDIAICDTYTIEIEDYRKYLILLLELNPYIIKYMGYIEIKKEEELEEGFFLEEIY